MDSGRLEDGFGPSRTPFNKKTKKIEINKEKKRGKIEIFEAPMGVTGGALFKRSRVWARCSLPRLGGALPPLYPMGPWAPWALGPLGPHGTHGCL